LLLLSPGRESAYFVQHGFKDVDAREVQREDALRAFARA
jgi:hypothetical protein